MRQIKSINEAPTTQDIVALPFTITDPNGNPVNDDIIWSVAVYFLRYKPGETPESELVLFAAGETNTDPIWDGSASHNESFKKTGDGEFTYYWDQTKTGTERSGNFVYVWTYGASTRISESQQFYIANMPNAISSDIGRKFNADNYYQLLEQMQPKFYYDSDANMPEEAIIFHNKLNRVLGQLIYDFQLNADRFVDLLDPDYTPSSFIPYLADMLNVKLIGRSSDLWRLQLKSAVLNYKQKGTRKGLENAFAATGAEILGVDQFWQVVSERQYVEEYTVSSDDECSEAGYTWEFTLSNPAQPSDTSYISILKWNGMSLEELTPWSDYIEFNGSMSIGWKDSAPTSLSIGDVIVVKYPLIPPEYADAEWDSLQDYILGLELLDLRQFTPGMLPPKNWNVRLISSDDVYLPLVCPDRFSAQDQVIFGYERTIIPYSEKVYNSDEYDGSVRPTTDPCKINNDFVDVCSCCKSSAVDLTIKQDALGDVGIHDATDLAERNLPFHTTIHKISWHSGLTDVLLPPDETLYVYIHVFESEPMFTGNPATNIRRDNAQEYLRKTFGILSTVLLGSNGVRADLFTTFHTPGVFIPQSSKKLFVSNKWLDISGFLGNSTVIITGLPGDEENNDGFITYGVREWTGPGSVSYINGKLTITLPEDWDQIDYDVSLTDSILVKPYPDQDQILAKIMNISGNTITTDVSGAYGSFVDYNIQFYYETASGTYWFTRDESYTLEDNTTDFVAAGIQTDDYVIIGGGASFKISSVAQHKLILSGGPVLPVDPSEYAIVRVIPYSDAMAHDSQESKDRLLVMVSPSFPFLIPVNEVTELLLSGNYRLTHNLAKEVENVIDNLAVGEKGIIPSSSDSASISESVRIDVHDLNNNQHTIIDI